MWMCHSDHKMAMVQWQEDNRFRITMTSFFKHPILPMNIVQWFLQLARVEDSDPHHLPGRIQSRIPIFSQVRPGGGSGSAFFSFVKEIWHVLWLKWKLSYPKRKSASTLPTHLVKLGPILLQLWQGFGSRSLLFPQVGSGARHGSAILLSRIRIL